MSQRLMAVVLKGAERLKAAGIDDPRFEADLLMAYILDWEKHQLYLEPDFALDEEACARFKACIDRRVRFEPIAHILGVQEFYGMAFKVSPATLIPRPDTETLVEVVLRHLEGKDTGTVLDLGTGTGCILLSVLEHHPAAVGVGVDLSTDAAALAEENAKDLGLAGRSEFYVSNWFENVPQAAGGYSVIVSNPPYVTAQEMKTLMPDVRDYEPASALDGGGDGLDPYRLICREAGAFLSEGGLLAFEVGYKQAGAVCRLMEEAGFSAVSTVSDLAGRDRVVHGNWQKN